MRRHCWECQCQRTTRTRTRRDSSVKLKWHKIIIIYLSVGPAEIKSKLTNLTATCWCTYYYSIQSRYKELTSRCARHLLQRYQFESRWIYSFYSVALFETIEKEAGKAHSFKKSYPILDGNCSVVPIVQR